MRTIKDSDTPSETPLEIELTDQQWSIGRLSTLGHGHEEATWKQKEGLLKADYMTKAHHIQSHLR